MTWKNERDCGIVELYCRKAVSSLFYYRGYVKLFPGNPYYTPGAVRAVERFLTPDSRVFEYGSGRSTLWYAARVKEYTAVEHDSSWLDFTRGQLLDAGHYQAEVLHITPQTPPAGYSWERDWPCFQLLQHPPRRPEFRDYMFAIDRYPDRYFDCVAIDGRERIGCLVQALSKVVPGGIIVFDDTNRPRYKEAFDLMSHWSCTRYDFGLQQTTIFRKPEDGA